MFSFLNEATATVYGQNTYFIQPLKSVFRIRVLFTGSGSAFFSESGSSSAKNPDPIRIRDKNLLKLES